MAHILDGPSLSGEWHSARATRQAAQAAGAPQGSHPISQDTTSSTGPSVRHVHRASPPRIA